MFNILHRLHGTPWHGSLHLRHWAQAVSRCNVECVLFLVILLPAEVWISDFGTLISSSATWFSLKTIFFPLSCLMIKKMRFDYKLNIFWERGRRKTVYLKETFWFKFGGNIFGKSWLVSRFSSPMTVLASAVSSWLPNPLCDDGGCDGISFPKPCVFWWFLKEARKSIQHEISHIVLSKNLPKAALPAESLSTSLANMGSVPSVGTAVYDHVTSTSERFQADWANMRLYSFMN